MLEDFYLEEENEEDEDSDEEISEVTKENLIN